MNCFKTIHERMSESQLQLNPGKTKIILFAPSKIMNEISIHGVQLTSSICTRLISKTKRLEIHIFADVYNLKNRLSQLKKTVSESCEIFVNEYTFSEKIS